MYLQTKIAATCYIIIFAANNLDKNPVPITDLWLSLIFLVLVDICWKLNNNKPSTK